MVDTFKVGDKVGGYGVVARLGGGEFGETWLCENQITKQKAVLKGLRKDIVDSMPAFLKDFDILARSREEAEILAALNLQHLPFVTVLYDAITVTDGRVFFLSEFVEGKQLQDWLAAQDLPNDKRARVAFQLLHAVIRLHSLGIVHRDLAGDNILIAGDTGALKIIDFGIAKIKSEIIVNKYSAKTVDAFTKFKYLPPKAILAKQAGLAAKSDESWDLYALGVLFFEILRGVSTMDPATEITKESLSALPCSETIEQLLENGRTENALSGPAIAITLNRELRQSNLEAAIVPQEGDLSVLTALNQEISQLRSDLAVKHGKTTHEDILQYLSRMELIFTVFPKTKSLSLDFDIFKGAKFYINTSDQAVLRMFTSGLRLLPGQAEKVLPILNQLNWASPIRKFMFDPKDGEVRLSTELPYAHSAIPYEEFSSLFNAMFGAAQVLLKMLESEFPQGTSKDG